MELWNEFSEHQLSLLIEAKISIIRMDRVSTNILKIVDCHLIVSILQIQESYEPRMRIYLNSYFVENILEFRLFDSWEIRTM